MRTRPRLILPIVIASLALPALADEPPVIRARPSGTSLEILTLVTEAARQEEEFPGQAGLLRALEGVRQEALSRPAELREASVRGGLERINAAAASLDEAPAGAAGRVANHLAYLNNTAGDWQEGRAFAERALQYDPHDREALISRANSQYGMRDYRAAFADADHAARLNPRSVEALRTRAMAAYGLQDYLQAVEDASRALALDPKDKLAFAILKLSEGKVPTTLNLSSINTRMAAEVQREYHGMVQQLSQAESRALAAPEGPAPRAATKALRDVSSKITVKDYLGALREADRALAEDPNNIPAHYYRAAANNLLGRYEDAVKDATRGLILKPTDTSLRDTRAWAFNRLGRFRDAIADSLHSLELDADDAYAYANLGYSHERMGDYDAMLREMRAAATLSPQFLPAYHDSASRHGLSEEPLPSERTAARIARVAARAQERGKAFSVLAVGAALGGVLVGLGLLQLGTALRGSGDQGGARSAIDSSYAIGKPIGHGGMGVIYEAVDRALNRRVAVKVMREELARDEKAKARFLEEARTVAALHHPGIVDIHSIMEDEAGVYMVFELVKGRTVEQLLAARGRLPLKEAKALLQQVCRALDFAHRNGVVHRDLKPGNIMVADDGQVKVMDFGISRLAGDEPGPGGRAPARGTAGMGTPRYMAPEQERGEVRRESDVYSLGVCLWEMLAGQPFPARLVPLSSLRPDLPSELDAFLERALDPQPDLRVRTANEFWALLERVPEKAGAAPSGPPSMS